MSPATRIPRALLLHDGELADVRSLLAELGVDVYERLGKPGVVTADFDLVVATPRRAPHLHGPNGARGPVGIAVGREDTRTLRARLRRQGIDFLARRPCHPGALRLLLLRALYRGPERRRAPRTCVGAPVGLRAGLRRKSGLLAELSAVGCRVLVSHRPRRGERLTLVLPGELAGGRSFAVRGEVLRARPAGDAEPGLFEVALLFRGLKAPGTARLDALVTRFAEGPASLPETAFPSDPAPDVDDTDRRRHRRRAFDRRVIALGDEAARVLVGRDLSPGGMRVEPGAALRVGECVRLALHGGVAQVPLVLAAEVVRDDGTRGFVLRFGDLGDEQEAHLARILRKLPAVADTRRGGGDIVLSEVLERRGQGSS